MDVSKEARTIESQASRDLNGSSGAHEQLLQHLAYLQKQDPGKLQDVLHYVAGDSKGNSALGIKADLETDKNGGIAGIKFGYDQAAINKLPVGSGAEYCHSEITGILPNPADEKKAEQLAQAIAGPKPGAAQADLQSLLENHTPSQKIDDIMQSLAVQANGGQVAGMMSEGGAAWQDQLYVNIPKTHTPKTIASVDLKIDG
jgi:hypothetical protein